MSALGGKAQSLSRHFAFMPDAKLWRSQAQGLLPCPIDHRTLHPVAVSAVRR